MDETETKTEKEYHMATKTKKTAAKKAVKAAAKKAAKPEVKKTGTVRDQFGLREGTARAKLVDALLAAKGKPVHIKDLLKTVYGKADEEWKTALNMVVQGMKSMIIGHKIKMEIIRDKDDKGSTIALKSK